MAGSPSSAADWLARHAATARRRHLAAGESLFRQGDRVTAIFRVESGRLRLVRHLADGSHVTLHTARDGDSFAEAALFSDSYHCDAVAEVESVVVVLAKRDLLAGLRRDPEAAMAFAAQMSRQVRDLRLRLELRNVRSAAARLEMWLHLQADERGRVVPAQSWTEIATELGLTREAVYRALARLQRDRRLRRDKTGIVLRRGL